MEFNEIQKIKDESEKINAIYDIFEEATRLDSKSSMIEFLTTIKYIEEFLQPGMKILDLGAGTGRYCLYLAEKGYEVVAVEIVDKHAQAINEAKTENMNLTVLHGNAFDILSQIESNAFDVILCFGPLYHLEKEKQRKACVHEIKRVCKPNGCAYLAFINNDMVITTETMSYDTQFIKSQEYDHTTFKVKDFPFVFYTVEAIRELINECGLSTVKEIASDGLSELLADKINDMDNEAYQLWLNYHFYTCEKPECIGFSNHLLFIAKP